MSESAHADGRSYGGRTAAERRAERRAALIEAGLDVLAEQGLTGIGVRAVCHRSELTARYFYESFPGIDDLLEAISAQVGAEVAAAGLAGLRSVPDAPDRPEQEVLADRVRACNAAAFDLVLDDPRKATVVALGAGHARMAAARQRLLLDYADLVVSQAAVVAPATAGGLGRATAILLVGGAVELVTAVLTGAVELSRDDLVDHTTEIFLTVLGGADHDR